MPCQCSPPFPSIENDRKWLYQLLLIKYELKLPSEATPKSIDIQNQIEAVCIGIWIQVILICGYFESIGYRIFVGWLRLRTGIFIQIHSNRLCFEFNKYSLNLIIPIGKDNSSEQDQVKVNEMILKRSKCLNFVHFFLFTFVCSLIRNWFTYRNSNKTLSIWMYVYLSLFAIFEWTRLSKSKQQKFAIIFVSTFLVLQLTWHLL